MKSNEIRIEGRLEGRNRRFAIAAARFNSRIVDLLICGAVDCLERCLKYETRDPARHQVAALLQRLRHRIN